MKVYLIDPSGGKNFKIDSLSSLQQAVGDNYNTVWRWAVEPLKSGKNSLRLTASVTLKNKNGEEATRDFDVFEREIQIKTSYLLSIKQFALNNWQWLVTAMVIPLGGWLFSRLKHKKKNSSSFEIKGFIIPKKPK